MFLLNKRVFLLLAIVPACWADSLIDINNYRPLTSDQRSYRVGEPVVVAVAESTSAESSAGTGANSDTAIGISSFDNQNQMGIGANLNGNGDAAGQTTRRGKAFTRLSVRINEVLPNGLLAISGEQNLLINGENQKIQLSGVIRSADINKDNVIVSSRIADAKIEIIGDGDVSSAQRQSLIFRLMKWLGVI